jgi:beta-xylosidase
VLFAPDVTVTTDADGKKTYYLFPNNQGSGRNSMIAKSDRPDGPFTVCNWHKERPRETFGCLGFDPAVFVDDDGRVYGYWGFGISHGAELDPAISTVQNNPTMNGNSLQQFNRLSQFNNGVFQPNPFLQSIYRDWQLNNNSF